MQKSPKKDKPAYITWYFQHYFHGEYDLTQFRDINFWIGQEIDRNTMEEYLEWKYPSKDNQRSSLRDEAVEKEFRDFVKSKYDIEPEAGITHIMHLQFQNKNIRTVHSAIKERLIPYTYKIIAECGGDDDTFDYMPDTVYAVIQILKKIPGTKSEIDSIEKALELTQE